MNKLYALGLVGALVTGSISGFASGPGKQTKARSNAISPDAIVMTGRLIVKLKPGIPADVLKSVEQTLQATPSARIFPRHQALKKEDLATGKVDLSRMYEMRFAAPFRMEEVLRLSRALPGVEYAEPRYIHKTTYTPNDPSLSSQAYLTRIKAREAWDLYKGDTGVVVGIVDSGVDWDHPDLIENIAYNYADPIDGVDNDNDGYIDNFRGWDLAGANFSSTTEDNEPSPTGFNNGHGTHVAGCAAPSTDNGTGVAGPGFRSRVLPIKCAADNDTRADGGQGYILAGYEGIVYGADHGCDVINCSWGGAGLSSYENDVINYATFNRNALVVAAAGNNNSGADFFPACFNNVLSVAATNSYNDQRAGFSNYNSRIGISAPGVDILSTIYNGGYANSSGTSMASPIVAGAAALLRGYFPSYSPRQIAQQLRATSDNHYVVNQNPIYAGKLGKGRLNMFRALSESIPGLTLKNYSLADGNDEFFEAGDTIRLSASFLNVLNTSSAALTATFSTESADVDIVQSTATQTLGVVAQGDSIRPSGEVLLVVQPGVAEDAEVVVRVDFRDGNYTDFAVLTISLNSTYVTFAHNIIAASVASNGRIGYAGENQAKGVGVQLIDWGNMLYEMGQVTTRNAGTVQIASSVRNNSQGYNDDFAVLSNIKPFGSPQFADYEYQGTYQSGRFNLNYEHQTYVWDGGADTGFFIHEYTLRNRGTAALNDFYTGYFADPDVTENGQADVVRWDSAYHMAYVMGADSLLSNSGGPYMGIVLLTPGQTRNFMPITNDGTSGSINVYDGFSEAEAHASLSSGITGTRAPATGRADVSLSVGYGPVSLSAGATQRLGYAVCVGWTLAGLRRSAEQADSVYQTIVTKTVGQQSSPAFRLYPNPAQHTVQVDCPIGSTVEILDLQGRIVNSIKQTKAGTATLSVESLQPGVYMARFVNAKTTQLQRFVKQ